MNHDYTNYSNTNQSDRNQDSMNKGSMNHDKQILFTDTLEQIRQKAKAQGGCVSQEELEAAFGPLALTDAQMSLVQDYLRQNRIGIGEPPDPDDYLAAEEKDYLETYLEELRALPPLSEGEKEAVTLSAMAGDIDARNRLTEAYLPEVAEIAKLYAGQGVFLEDLIGEGNAALFAGVGMLGAMEHASEAQGMLGKMIMDAMEDAIAENAETDRRNGRIADKVNRVADAARELAEELHRKVTVKELAAESGISRKAIEDAVRISGGRIEDIADGTTR